MVGKPSYHSDPDARKKTEAFEIGMKVKVISPAVDFYYFRGETGTVIENSGRYLGIIVRFDEPRRFKDGGTQEQFNFNYYDLEPLSVELDVPALLADLAALRRQLAEAQAEMERYQRGAELHTGMLGDVIATLERDLADARDDATTATANLAECRMQLADLRRQLDAAQGEIDKRDKWALDVLKTPILTGIDLPELLRDIDIYKAETHRLLVDNAKMRFYVVELENASRTIDMHLAQQAAREKYEAAFGDQADEGRPIAVDRPPTINACQLPEGHDGPHERICLACNGTGELDSTPVYMRCPLCYGSGKTA